MSKRVQINMRLSGETLEKLDGIRKEYDWNRTVMFEGMVNYYYGTIFSDEQPEPIPHKPTDEQLFEMANCLE